MSDFPATKGRSLQQVANDIGASGPQVGLATTDLVTGTQRLAFGVLDQKNRILYGKTAVYIARSPTKKALGPFPAPADSLVTDPAYRSRQAASETDPFSAIYEAQVPFAKPGKYAVLVVTDVQGTFAGATTMVEVKDPKDDKVPNVGDPAPLVSTDTLASVRGNRGLLDTRVPPSDMHALSFKDAVGKKPVALLFATPQLCQSRVCGPVTDIAYQLEQSFKSKVTFIHQEVYADNNLNKGLRPPLQAFHLQTEPWLFVVGTDGKIKARLEGSFGFRAFEGALRAGMQ